MRTQTRCAMVGLGGVAYLLASRWLTTAAPASPWNPVALLAPLLLVAAALAWGAGHRLRAGLALLLLAALALHAAFGGAVPLRPLYAGEHIVAHLALAVWFGRTLRPGAQPLITQLAARLHGLPGAATRRYTRRVTQAWTCYFMAMALLSLGLYRLAAFDAWLAFANLLTPLALAAMFVGEHLLRYRLHPEFERASMLDSIRAYTQHAAAAPAPRQTP